MILGDFELRNLTPADFPSLHRWFQEPHVKEWWGTLPTVRAIADKYAPRLLSKEETFCLVLSKGVPFAFLQYYKAASVGGGWWKDQSETTVGIDHFIGEPSYLRKGLGRAYIKAVSDWLLSCADIEKVIADPRPDNTNAIKCFEAAGFLRKGEITTPDGMAMLMEKTNG